MGGVGGGEMKKEQGWVGGGGDKGRRLVIKSLA